MKMGRAGKVMEPRGAGRGPENKAPTELRAQLKGPKSFKATERWLKLVVSGNCPRLSSYFVTFFED